VLVLYRTGQGTTLFGRGRDVTEIEKAVTFDVTSCLWRVDGDASEVHRSDERSAIITALRDSDEPLTAFEIADIAGISRSSIRMMLSRMAKAGKIKREKRGRYACAPQPPCYNGYNGLQGR
jgi:predicted HTH transcriptional regulator